MDDSSLKSKAYLSFKNALAKFDEDAVKNLGTNDQELTKAQEN
jgi:hypothetical protein